MTEKFGILGAGSIGCYIAAHLLRAGYDTRLVGRAALQESVQKHGLRITKAGGGAFHVPPSGIRVSTSVDDLRDCSIVLVTVKSGDTARAATELSALGTTGIKAVVSLQNGIHNTEILRARLPHVIAGMVPYNVNWLPDAHFHCGTSGAVILGDQPQDISASLLRIFLKSGLEARTHPRMDGILWGKLLVNLNNPLNALADLPLKEELLDRGYRKILASLMSEGLEILGAAGIKAINPFGVNPHVVPTVLRLPNVLFRQIAARMISIDPEARSSMWQDLQSGRLTEIDFINGEIVKLAKSLSLAAPKNAALVALIREREQRPPENRVQALSANELQERIST